MSMSFGVIVLAAGKGSRMNSDIPKQYINIGGYPVLYYSLKVFQEYGAVDRIVITTSVENIDMVRYDIVGKYGFSKVSDVIQGGKERYDSVYNALQVMDGVDYVMIHDGARPCVNARMLDRLCESVMTDKASVPAVPSKDTVRLADDNGYVTMTPDRKYVWNIQTPQVFEMQGICNAYNRFYRERPDCNITDDAMIWEMYDSRKLRLVMGDYMNIKITTPEDIGVAERIIMP